MFSTDIYTPSEASFQPTYLYIKQHTITGKLYFGKTTRNPEKYQGSGKHWMSHIKKHGSQHVITLWYCLYHDADECSKMAIMFSEQQNIVESSDWLNMKLENGLDGGTTGLIIPKDTPERLEQKRQVRLGTKHSEETKAKIAESLLHRNFKSDDTEFRFRTARIGKTHSDETKQKIRDTRVGKKSSVETIQKSLNTRAKNRSMLTPEEKELKRLARKPISEETKQKMSQSRIGLKHSEETRRKIGEANRRRAAEKSTE